MQKTELDVAYLYFLFDAQSDVFKIGKALNIWNRISQLPDRIDVSRSRCLVFISKPNFSASAQALKVEGFFKAFCKNHNIPKVHKKDGYTEWYEIAAFEKIQSFIKINRNFLDCGSIQELPTLVELRPKPIRVLDDIRKTREVQLSKEDESRQAANYESLNKTYKWLAETLVEGSMVGWVSNYLVTWRSKIGRPELVCLRKKSGFSALIGSYTAFGDFEAHGFVGVRRWIEIFDEYQLDGLQAFTEIFEQIPVEPVEFATDLEKLINANYFQFDDEEVLANYDAMILDLSARYVSGARVVFDAKLGRENKFF